MKQKLLYGVGTLLLTVLVGLLVWQGSFSFGDFAPAGPQQVTIFWAVSTVVFLLTVLIGFLLFRTFVKIYLERQRNREGSRLRTKLLVAALGITILPVFFFALFSVYVLNRNLDKWFSRPAISATNTLVGMSMALERGAEGKATAQAELLASRPEVLDYANGNEAGLARIQKFCVDHGIAEAMYENKEGRRLPLCSTSRTSTREHAMRAALPDLLGTVWVRAHLEASAEAEHQKLLDSIAQYDQLAVSKRELWQFYLLLLALICLFILFLSTWAVLLLAKQISVPIAELLKGAEEVRQGNLTYRLETKAADELATLVSGFNDMTQSLEANDKELERRRRFTEAILENIPTGVVSVGAEGRVLRVNRAMREIFPEMEAELSLRLEDLFPKEEAGELRYMMKRARRTGIAMGQFEFLKEGRRLHLGVTVSTVEENPGSPFVLVIEDTSELLRAQKQAAWHEVARRVAHEIKNPLTPIALSAERIARQLDRAAIPPENARVLRECSALISREVETVRTLVDEFSQFARFPAAQMAAVDLNGAVENAMRVFEGRLEGITVDLELSPDLPLVHADGEQLKRVVVNLVDNAAEAMHEAHVKRLYVGTHPLGNESVELVVSDSGSGVSKEDREKLFLPYFSTKGRGTGLGLAIVNHILSEHHAQIRVEENQPIGARFVIELPAWSERESDALQDGKVEARV
ncbi:HAMP domain-containing histidine kinase [Bryobacter aggregatus]|uniref:HAMP domain-containing histidine kinase n=1 Tax=Bryobacter aggregatus TaxID=360054 RepID=UPI0006915730|nr:HAMP domain-containing histidine kinase [Bryobacter aggregatus]